MPAWWSGSVAAFHASDPAVIAGILTTHLMRSHSINHPQQERAWRRDIALLGDALRAAPPDWRLLLEYPMLRLERRIDALLITDRAILVLEFKGETSNTGAADQRQVADYAIDLFDFHAASRSHPIVPVLVSITRAPPGQSWPLLWHAVTPVLTADQTTFAATIRAIIGSIPAPDKPLDIDGWEAAPYRPVPNIIDAACLLYARNAVADIKAARADATNLTSTTEAILGIIRAAGQTKRRAIVFVTGIPGAGKTLCGLNVVFGAKGGEMVGATFLTGNPTLVHVLRGALARSEADGDRRALGPARRHTRTLIQALPAFRDDYVAHPAHVPAERVIVIDEAQRAWSRAHAIRKSRDRPVSLTDSEPAILLDIMARHPDWSVIVCLVGGGQEIHDGEGGLAEWGRALATRPEWHVSAAPTALSETPARQFLPADVGIIGNPALHLSVPVRHIHGDSATDWVDAVLHGDAISAARIAASSKIPFRVTRSLDQMRTALRRAAIGLRRAGLLASSGAARLRADGLGASLPHMDAAAVEHWFLDRWPEDVRASDALELLATEFSCQGLELDYCGLCWGGDLIRVPGRTSWRARAFSGTRWQQVKDGGERFENRLNTYRVLLTRARFETIIWVPVGNPADATRPPHEGDAVAAFLRACGAAMLEDTPSRPAPVHREPVLL